MGDQSGRTRSQHRKGSTSQPSEEDVLFRLRLVEALIDQQVADKIAQIIRAGNQNLLDSLSSLRAEIKSLRAELADRDVTIVNWRGQIQRLREDHDALEQYGRRNNLRVSGIPEPNLQQGETKDTTSAVVNLANEVLKLDPPLQNSHIEVSHRLKKSRHARSEDPRSIIVHFRSKSERFQVISNRKELKNYNATNDNKVFINEDLTAMGAKLFSTVRALHRKKQFQQVWTYNCTIRVKEMQRTVQIIHNNEDI